ncbi:alpha/beta fold hydrolase [Idiomarina sp. 29L]|uniref:alpha/beta fold hydrolase n=1 Tax=Idiomarina sp. 29L TaxID=2508877 RepID=UPI0010120F52|nr:alpha/beta fold hydrolase [Idiomarina sp. 29L]RXS42404.1 alpha/beta fold hydrolase [Idiomarina sp. 29L]
MVLPIARSFHAQTPYGRLKGYRYGFPDTPAIVVQGGISATGKLWTPSGDGWWQSLHRLFANTDDYQFISFDYFGGLGGSDCPDTPLSVKEHSNAIHHAVQSILPDESLHGWIGGSFGGVLGLQCALDHPDAIDRLSVVGAAHKPSVHSSLLRYFQQALIQRCNDAQLGVVLARALAMLSYRSAEEFESRFRNSDDAFEYLLYKGEQLLKENGNSSRSLFTHLTPILNEYTINPELIETPVHLVDFTSDAIAPPSLVAELEALLPNCTSRVSVESEYGHDGFIKNVPEYGTSLKHFLFETHLETT